MIPIGSKETRIIILGNLLYDESFIMRIKEDIDKGITKGIFRAYPLIDEYGKNLWPAKFRDRKTVEELRNKLPIGIWAREYLLRIYERNGNEEPHISFYENDNYSLKMLFETINSSPEFKGYKVYDGENGGTKQKPLVESMKQFIIRAPVVDPIIFFPSPEDPRYLKHFQNFYLPIPPPTEK